MGWKCNRDGQGPRWVFEERDVRTARFFRARESTMILLVQEDTGSRISRDVIWAGDGIRNLTYSASSARRRALRI